MKNLYLLSIIVSANVFCQDISSVNSGAVSNNNLIHSVGEIFVIPENPDYTNSGILGVVSWQNFLNLELVDVDNPGSIQVYPNPVSNILYLKAENQIIQEVFVYDLSGKLILNTRLSDQNSIDLSDISPGIYILKTDNIKIKTVKIIKK